MQRGLDVLTALHAFYFSFPFDGCTLIIELLYVGYYPRSSWSGGRCGSEIMFNTSL
jgi:hypothetical protein